MHFCYFVVELLAVAVLPPDHVFSLEQASVEQASVQQASVQQASVEQGSEKQDAGQKGNYLCLLKIF